MSSPFEIARAIGNQGARGIRESRDQSSIDTILGQAFESEDPQVLQQTIGQILSQVSPQRQPEAIKLVQGRMEAIKSAKEKTQRIESAKEGGYDPYAPPQVQAQQLKNKAKEDYFRASGLNSPSGPTSGPTQSGQPAQNISGGEVVEQTETVTEQTPNGIEQMSDSQLRYLTGAPYKEISEPAKAVLQKREDDRKIGLEKEKLDRMEKLQFHKETQKFDDEITNNEKIAKSQVRIVEDIGKKIATGNIKPASMANIFKGMGTVGDKISEAMINEDQAALQASIPSLLEGWKQVFGVRLTDADLRLLSDKLPSIGKSPEANRSVLKVIKKYAQGSILRSQIARDIKKENKGLRPLGYSSMIEERFDEMSAPVTIITPQGKELQIPANKVSEAIRAGGKLKQDNPNE